MLERFFNENKITHHPGAAHFILVRPRDRDGAVRYLREHGILVRPMVAPLIQDMFRMNAGSLEQTKHFMDVYKKYIEEYE